MRNLMGSLYTMDSVRKKFWQYGQVKIYGNKNVAINTDSYGNVSITTSGLTVTGTVSVGTVTVTIGSGSLNVCITQPITVTGSGSLSVCIPEIGTGNGLPSGG